MFKTMLHVLAVIAIGFIAGIVGWIIGALIGGNYAEQFVFNAVQGYEATGQVGFIFGALISAISSWRLLVKGKSSPLPR